MILSIFLALKIHKDLLAQGTATVWAWCGLLKCWRHAWGFLGSGTSVRSPLIGTGAAESVAGLLWVSYCRGIPGSSSATLGGHPPLTMRSHSHHTFSRSLAWSVYGRATLWTLVAPGQQTPLSGLPKVSHFLTILASTVFFKS